MWSYAKFTLIFFTFLSIIAGLILESWVFFMLSICTFSVLAVMNRGAIEEEVKLKVERKSEKKSVYEDDDLWIELSIKNEGQSLNYLEVHDVVPEDVELVKGSNHQILKLEENEEKILKYKIACSNRGKVEIGPIKFRYRDPLNLHFEEWTSQKPMALFILPKIEEIESINIRPLYTRKWLGNIRSQNMGRGTEFFSIREYLPQDDMRKINWKATSRFLEPMSNEYVGERSGDVIIIVDGHSIGNEKMNTLDITVRAAGSIASSVLADRNRVGLIILGDILDWIYPDTGRDHYYKILEKLSKVEGEGHWKLQDTDWLLKRFLPGKSMIIFISPLLSEKTSQTIIDISRKENNVMVLSPDPLEIQKEVMDEYSPLAEQLTRLQRELVLEKLWDYSMVVDWDPNKTLESSLEEVVRYWRKSQEI